MNSNFFFKKKNYRLSKIFSSSKLEKDFIINDVKPLYLAKKNDLTFFDSIRYQNQAINTKASACITTNKLEKLLPKNVEKIIVKNVLVALANALKKIYPSADIDYPDFSVKHPSKNKFKSVKFGNNVLIGQNVKIGKNSIVGSNSVIESNVQIGKNCVIGSEIVIKNAIIGEKVVIQDGTDWSKRIWVYTKKK